jgi:hypothetical protein
MTWKHYKFPAWVPLNVRKQIRSFWSADCGRSPDAWLKGTVFDPYNHHPKLGDLVTCKDAFFSINRKLRGRWVPMWNNIGRLVTSKGEVFVVSTGSIVRREIRRVV